MIFTEMCPGYSSSDGREYSYLSQFYKPFDDPWIPQRPANATL